MRWLRLAIVFIGLVGCGEGVVTPTKRIPAASSTTTQSLESSATPEPTETVTAIATPTRAATATIEPTRASAPTFEPTSTPLPAIAPTVSDIVWEVPSTNGYRADVDYQLVLPSAESLLQIFFGLADYLHEHEFAGILYGYQSEDDIRDVLAHDLSQLSMTALEPSLNLVSEFENLGYSFEGDRTARRYVQEAAIIAALNQSGTTLEKSGTVSGIDYYPFAADLNNDGTTDWLLRVVMPGLSIPAHFFVPVFYASESNRFDVLPHEINYYNLFPEDEYKISFDIDITGDEVPEILIVQQRGEAEDYLRLLTWENGRLKPLSFSSSMGVAASSESRISRTAYSFEDFDNDDVVELQVTTSGGGWNLKYKECDTFVTQFDWVGSTSTETLIKTNNDIDSSCLASKMLFTSSYAQPLPPKDMLLKVVESLTSSDWQEHPVWYALIHIDLATHYWIEGNSELTRETINAIWLQNNDFQAPDDYLTELDTIWQNAGADFYNFCHTLRRSYWSSENPFFGGPSAEYGDRLYHLGGRYNRALQSIPLGEFFCATTAVTEAKIVSLQEQNGFITPQLFKQSGISIVYEQEVNFDLDADMEIIGIVDAGTHLLGLWDQVNGAWQYKTLSSLNGGFSLEPNLLTSTSWVDLLFKDVAGDETNELLLLRSITNKDPDSQMSPRSILSIYSLTEDKMLYQDDMNNTLQQSLDALTSDDVEDHINRTDNIFSNGFSSEPAQLILDGEETVYFRVLSDFVRQIISAESIPILRQQMFKVRSQVPIQEINAELVIQELDYLIAYSYEIEGNSAEAITHYRRLIETAPQSYWSWLALAKLQPVDQ